jgi:deazaflavin-dependent oxidoreductase (nitroreductase family)
MMRLTTIGRRTGQERSVILGYFEDGPNLVTLAMSGWADGEPAWWLNLQAHPETSVDLIDGRRMVRGRAAEGAPNRSFRQPTWPVVDIVVKSTAPPVHERAGGMMWAGWPRLLSDGKTPVELIESAGWLLVRWRVGG